MAENKKQRAEIEKAIALQFMEENQKQVNSFRDAISKEHILLTPEDIKTVLELVRDRKKEEENVQTEDDGKSAEKSQKDENQPSEKSDEKSEKSPDEKSDENQKK